MFQELFFSFFMSRKYLNLKKNKEKKAVKINYFNLKILIL